jgi:hypothetical protein
MGVRTALFNVLGNLCLTAVKYCLRHSEHGESTLTQLHADRLRAEILQRIQDEHPICYAPTIADSVCAEIADQNGPLLSYRRSDGQTEFRFVPSRDVRPS